MRSSKLVFLVVLILIGLLAAACAAPAAPPPAPATAVPPAQPTAVPAAAAAGKGSIAVVLTGPWQDHSWNEAGYQAVQALGKQGV